LLKKLWDEVGKILNAGEKRIRVRYASDTESLDIYSAATARAVSRRPFAAGTWVQSQAGICGIYGVKSGRGPGFSPSTSVSPVNIISTMFSIHSSSTTLYETVELIKSLNNAMERNRGHWLGLVPTDPNTVMVYGDVANSFCETEL
jgi:hypothetical protein